MRCRSHRFLAGAMIDFEVKAVIDRPVNEVFAYVTDPAKLATWQTNTVAAEQLDDGPLRRGSRLREVHRGPGGRELLSTVEVTELEQNRVFALHVLEGTLPIDAASPSRRGREGRCCGFGPTGSRA